MVMVKPGMPYLDVLRRARDHRVLAGHLIGEGRHGEGILHAAQNGWIDGERAMMESLVGFKRAGADGVLTYFAPQAAEKLKAGR